MEEDLNTGGAEEEGVNKCGAEEEDKSTDRDSASPWIDNDISLSDTG